MRFNGKEIKTRKAKKIAEIQKRQKELKMKQIKCS